MAMINDISKGRTCSTNESIDYFTSTPDLIYSSVRLLGRGAHATGRSLPVPQKFAAAGENPDLETPYDNRTRIAKVYRPEGSQGSGIDTSRKAEQYGEKYSLTNNCEQPPSLTCPIMSTRESTGSGPPGSRIPHCFARHFCSRQAGRCHGETGAGNLTDKPLSKKWNPNDLDPARFAGQEGPREQVNMGTLPFVAMRFLLLEESDGDIPRRYCHEAEAFAWVLIYICGTAREHEGKVVTADPNPFRHWLSKYQGQCWDDKLTLVTTIRNLKLPVHDHARPLLVGLCNLWGRQYLARPGIRGESDAIPPEFVFDGIEDGDEPPLEQHKESSDLRTFANVVAVFGKTLRANTPEYNHAVELVKKSKESGIDSVQ